MAFIDDIQSRDTALFPVVSIDSPVADESLFIDSSIPLVANFHAIFTTFYHDGLVDDFSVGEYIRIDEEYMRVISVSHFIYARAYVKRGLFGSDRVLHGNNTLIYKSVLGEINPVRKIDISTKDFNLGNTHYNPLLLSTPSRKESIDLANRKYKISNVSLKISNVEYNGLRFTDNQILLNAEVVIHWVSPSCTTIDDCYLAFIGTVRNITHDEKTCSITLEDISQSTLHTDVPKEMFSYSGSHPERHKGKPIPMVYGHVDRSPCVIDYAPESIEADAHILSAVVDTRVCEELLTDDRSYGVTASLHISPLFIDNNDAFVNLYPDTSVSLLYSYVPPYSNFQYNSANNNIIEFTAHTINSDTEESSLTDSGENKGRVFTERDVEEVTLHNRNYGSAITLLESGSDIVFPIYTPDPEPDYSRFNNGIATDFIKIGGVSTVNAAFGEGSYAGFQLNLAYTDFEDIEISETDNMKFIGKIVSTATAVYEDETEDDLISDNQPVWGIAGHFTPYQADYDASYDVWYYGVVQSTEDGAVGEGYMFEGDDDHDSQYGSSTVLDLITDNYNNTTPFTSTMNIGHSYVLDEWDDPGFGSDMFLVEQNLKLYDAHFFVSGLIPNLHKKNFFVNVKGRMEID